MGTETEGALELHLLIDTGVETTGELETLIRTEWCGKESSRILGQLPLTHPKSSLSIAKKILEILEIQHIPKVFCQAFDDSKSIKDRTSFLFAIGCHIPMVDSGKSISS